jgi:hypothetical protein
VHRCRRYFDGNHAILKLNNFRKLLFAWEQKTDRQVRASICIGKIKNNNTE